MRDEADKGRILVVDLDGTLIRSDLLMESFWAGLARDWRTPFHALSALRGGRAALKQRMAASATLRPELLPYHDAVLSYVTDWRANGGRTALVSAADQSLAETVATHLGVFDEVHGSDGTTNLKGPAKAAFLTNRFGAEGFDYIGDSAADIPVWQAAKRAITVGASTSLRATLAQSGREITHLAPPPGYREPFLQALRPHQWFKNVLVFFPLVASHSFTADAFLQSLLAFVAFALVASGVYVLNDLLDLTPDRAHPRKRNRPFASGRLPIIHGMWMSPALLLSGLLVAAFLGREFIFVMLGYTLLTTAYSLWLKRQTLIDILVLAGLYTLRIVAGAVATGVSLSVWLLAFSMFLFLALAAVKRQAELVDTCERGLTNASGRGYQTTDLPLIAGMAIASGYVAVLVLALYLNSPEVADQYGQPALLWGVCLVLIYWFSRVVMFAHRGQMHDDPVVFATKDRVSRISMLLVILLFAAALLL